MGEQLPKETSPAIIISFLEKFLKGKTFTISKEDWDFPNFVKNVTKELYIQLVEVLKTKQIDDLNLPNKVWLVGALYTLSPLHSYFKPEKSISVHDLILLFSD